MAIDNSLQKCAVQVIEVKDRISIGEGNVWLTFSKQKDNFRKTQ